MIATLFVILVLGFTYAALAFGVLLSLWGKGMAEFVFFIVIVALATYATQLVWRSLG